MKLGFELLGYFFRQMGPGDTGARVALPDGRVVKRLPGMHEQGYQSVFGKYVLPRWVYGVRKKQAQAYVMLDAPVCCCLCRWSPPCCSSIRASASPAAPQLNIFSVDFPVSLLMGLLLIRVGLPGVLELFSEFVDEGYRLLKAWFN